MEPTARNSDCQFCSVVSQKSAVPRYCSQLSVLASGQSLLGCMAGPSARRMLDGWCSVFHQSTENLMIVR